MFETRFTKLFGIKYPIMQGSLGYLSHAELVSAVSNAGGLGSLVITGFDNVEELRAEIRKTRSMTDKPFSVNLPFLPGEQLMPYEDITRIVCEEKVAAVEVISQGKIPDDIFNLLKKNDVKIIHKLSKVKHALSSQKQGVDAIALLGYGSDGHPGLDEITHLVEIPKAADVLDIPFLMAGSVADARGFVAALAMGADGVLMGTRFLMAAECPVHPNIKNWMIQQEEGDAVLVDVTHGFPMRRIKNKPALKALELEKSGAPLEEIIEVTSGRKAGKAWREGDIDGGAFGCGQVIGLINEIKTAKEIIDDIINESKTIINRLNSLTA